MDVSVRYLQEHPEHQKIAMGVKFYEQIDGLGFSADLNVWVPTSDSRSELETLAKVEAQHFLKRVLSGHSV